MGNSKYIKLNKKIEELKSLVEKLDVYGVSNRLFHELIMFSHSGERGKLTSPARQSLYLLGIMMAQKNHGVEKCTDEKMNRVFSLLNDIFGKYLDVYFPDESEIGKGLDSSWFESRKSSMVAFLGYFFESRKIATDVLRLEVLNSYEKFEEQITEHFGLSCKDMVAIADRIGQLIQNNVDGVYDVLKVLDEKRLEFANSNVDEYHKNLTSLQDACAPLMQDFMRLSEETCIFSFNEITEIEIEKIEQFKRCFVSTKGGSNEIKYITDDNPLKYSPILTVNGEKYSLCSVNYIFFAIQNKIEEFLKGKEYSESFRKFRDTKLEKDTKTAFREFLPENALLFESVFENDKSVNEHDLVIITGKTVLIIEAKASPRREPLRDPSKAFTRIRDDFKKKSGIQSGCNQAFSLRKLIENNDATIFYDKKGNIQHTITKEDFDEVFCICVTKDDFGMLATDLTALLDKPAGIDYPWVINIDDLKFFFSCLKYIDKDWDFFMGYLRERVQVMGKVIAGDELEIAGAYLKYNGFGFVNERSQHLFLDINESTVFDDIHMAKFNNEPYVLENTEPAFFELDRRKFFQRENKKEKKKTRKNIEQKRARRKNRK
ncbi:hypothetical protein ACTV70_000126 [Cronobacter dublinensis]